MGVISYYSDPVIFNTHMHWGKARHEVQNNEESGRLSFEFLFAISEGVLLAWDKVFPFPLPLPFTLVMKWGDSTHPKIS